LNGCRKYRVGLAGVLLALLFTAPPATGEAEGKAIRAESAASVPDVEMEGVLFFDRGHYWLEIHLEGMEGGPPRDKKLFRIVDASDNVFSPSRIEILEWENGRGVLLLSSGRLKGRACYRVILEPEGMGTVETPDICDPFYYEPGSEECAAKRFFRYYVAPAFSRTGESYRMNRFSYGYDLSDDRSRSGLVISPLFEIGGWGIEPSFEYRETAYDDGDSDDLPVMERRAGLDLSRSGWAGGLGLRLTVSYDHERFILRMEAGDSVRYAHSMRVAAFARFDNIFDSLNRHCLSVFKGVDLGFGYAWYLSNDEEVWSGGGMESTTPFTIVRATWTLFYGLQFSYALESYWPSTLNERFEEYHAVRVRLLLRDLLDKERRKSYHPDLEFSLDEGRRLPLFEREKRVSIGFTFDLFPW
jgi:hypothetical protein